MLRQRWRYRSLIKVSPAALSLFTRCLLSSRVIPKSSAPQFASSHRTSRPHSLTHLHCIHRNRFSSSNRPHTVSTSSLVSLQIRLLLLLLPKLRLHRPLQRGLASLFLLGIAIIPWHVHLLSSAIFAKRIFVLVLILHVFIILLLLQIILINFSLLLHSLFFDLSLFIFSFHHVIVGLLLHVPRFYKIRTYRSHIYQLKKFIFENK